MVDGKIHQLNHQSVYTFNPLNSMFNFKHSVFSPGRGLVGFPQEKTEMAH